MKDKGSNMKARKTIEVEQMVKWANMQLGRTDKDADVGFINNDDSEIGTVGYYSRYYTLPKN